MTQATATLAAASLAAAASLTALVVNAFLGRRSEMRAAHRDAIVEVVVDLGRAVHECLAISSVVLERDLGAGLARRNWLARGRRAHADLERLRLKTRYTLWGLSEPLRTLSRVPVWISHYPTKNGATGKELLEAASRLRISVDDVVRKSYAEGRPPTALERWRVGRRAAAVRRCQRRDFEPPGDPLEDESLAG